MWLGCSFGYNQNVLPVTKSWFGDCEGRRRLALLPEPLRPCSVVGDTESLCQLLLLLPSLIL